MTENESLTMQNLWSEHDLEARCSYYMIFHKHSIISQCIKNILFAQFLFYRHVEQDSSKI